MLSELEERGEIAEDIPASAEDVPAPTPTPAPAPLEEREEIAEDVPAPGCVLFYIPAPAPARHTGDS